VLYPLSYGGSGGTTLPASEVSAKTRGVGTRSSGPEERRYPGRVTPEQLSDQIVAVLADLHAEGALALPGGVPTAVTVERPRQKGHGDYATNVALQLAKAAGVAPRDLAAQVAERLRATDGVADVEVAGPGFLNISVDAVGPGR
jgi:arginyl-tRNA synthetase